jgi:peptide deformylase
MKVSEKIVQIDASKENPLRLHAKPVTIEEFGTSELKNIIKAMTRALSKESDGVAIAAPQIGISKRIFVVSATAYEEETKNKPLVFINPTITKRSKKTASMQEGCLSVRWIYGKTKRSIGATIEAYDIDGKKFTYGATGLIAHIFQHETDHLEGILFIDHGFDFEEFTEEEIKKGQQQQAKELH